MPTVFSNALPWFPSAVLITALVSGCAGDDPAPTDGQLDCTTESSWIGSASPVEGTVGTSDPVDALHDALSPYLDRHGGEIVVVDESIGSLVVEGREVVVVIAVDAPAGGWIVNTTRGCSGYES